MGQFRRPHLDLKMTIAAVLACLTFMLAYQQDVDSQASMNKKYSRSMNIDPWDLHREENGRGQGNSESSRCSPKRHVSFVKIYKTGSGAFHNVLIRLVLNHNMTMAFPLSKFGVGYSKFPNKALRKFIVNQPPFLNYSKYDVFFDHAVYNKETQLEYMASDTVFFTQIRQPFAQAESAFHYFKGVSKFGLQKSSSPVSAFINRNSSTGGCKYLINKYVSVICNFQAFSLGFKEASHNNATEFKAYLERLDSELIFVSILEMDAESSLLLKRKMCWHIRDVLHIHTHKTRTAAKKELADSPIMQAKEKHKELSSLDYMLYDFFKDKLLKQLSEQSADFFEELEEYKVLSDQFNQLCINMCDVFHSVSPNNVTHIRMMLQNGTDIPQSKFNAAFKMTYLDCLLLISDEPVDKVVVKVKQYPDACASKAVAAKYGLREVDCDFRNHVHPGYHIKIFEARVLNRNNCLGNYMFFDK